MLKCLPDAAVVPRSVEEIAALVQLANEAAFQHCAEGVRIWIKRWFYSNREFDRFTYEFVEPDSGN